MLLHEFLSTLPHRKNGPGDYHAACPGHDDSRTDKTKFSLHVTETAEAALMLHCFGGCPTDLVLAAMGLTVADLFNGSTGHVTPGPTSKPPIVATYDYVDGAGKLLYQTVRYAPKDFKQRQPSFPEGWQWNLAGVRRVLYRLPSLVDQARVILVEGEKDADRLHALGLVATTTVGGSSAWREEYAQQLVQLGVRAVVILPDHDQAGEKYAAAAARSCRSVGIEVPIVRLPGLSLKGDVSDWLDAGHTREELEALIMTAPEAPPQEPEA